MSTRKVVWLKSMPVQMAYLATATTITRALSMEPVMEYYSRVLPRQRTTGRVRRFLGAKAMGPRRSLSAGSGTQLYQMLVIRLWLRAIRRGNDGMANVQTFPFHHPVFQMRPSPDLANRISTIR